MWVASHKLRAGHETSELFGVCKYSMASNPRFAYDGQVRPVTYAHLLSQNGDNGQAILVSCLGIVYDCSEGEKFFGEGGPYRAMAGHDASYMLAKMSLKAEQADVFEWKLDDGDLQTLAEWVAYYDACYPRIGWLTERPTPHAVKLSDLPVVPRKKMGGNPYGGGDAEVQKQQHVDAEREYDTFLANPAVSKL